MPYLGVHVTLTLDWKHHFQYVQASVKSACLSLAAAHVDLESALRRIRTVIRPGIQYSLPLAIYTLAQITQLDQMLTATAK